jgi:hypothetical protein
VVSMVTGGRPVCVTTCSGRGGVLLAPSVLQSPEFYIKTQSVPRNTHSLSLL